MFTEWVFIRKYRTIYKPVEGKGFVLLVLRNPTTRELNSLTLQRSVYDDIEYIIIYSTILCEYFHTERAI
jgi:hypothetical protein